MANDKLVSRLLLIGLAVVILSVLIAQYRKSPSKQGQPIYGPMGREMFSVPSPVQAQYFTAQSASVKAGAGAGASSFFLQACKLPRETIRATVIKAMRNNGLTT